MRRFRACLAALFTVAVLAACQPPVRLMPAPALFLNGEHNLFAANPALDRSNRIQVFYATNRMALGPSAAPAYMVFPGDDLHLGVATLDIGGGAQAWDWLYEQSTSASAERRPQILVNSMDPQAAVPLGAPPGAPGAAALAFFRQVDQAVGRQGHRRKTVGL